MSFLKSSRNATSDSSMDAARAKESSFSQSRSGGDQIISLLRAAETGQVSTVESMLRQGSIDINAKDMNGHSALLVAADKGQYDVVRLLLDRGADASTCDNCGNTPLKAASKGGYQNIVDLLQGRSFDKAGQRGFTDDNALGVQQMLASADKTTIGGAGLMSNTLSKPDDSKRGYTDENAAAVGDMFRKGANDKAMPQISRPAAVPIESRSHVASATDLPTEIYVGPAPHLGQGNQDEGFTASNVEAVREMLETGGAPTPHADEARDYVAPPVLMATEQEGDVGFTGDNAVAVQNMISNEERKVGFDTPMPKTRRTNVIVARPQGSRLGLPPTARKQQMPYTGIRPDTLSGVAASTSAFAHKRRHSLNDCHGEHQEGPLCNAACGHGDYKCAEVATAPIMGVDHHVAADNRGEHQAGPLCSTACGHGEWREDAVQPTAEDKYRDITTTESPEVAHKKKEGVGAKLAKVGAYITDMIFGHEDKDAKVDETAAPATHERTNSWYDSHKHTVNAPVVAPLPVAPQDNPIHAVDSSYESRKHTNNLLPVGSMEMDSSMHTRGSLSSDIGTASKAPVAGYTSSTSSSSTLTPADLHTYTGSSYPPSVTAQKYDLGRSSSDFSDDTKQTGGMLPVGSSAAGTASGLTPGESLTTTDSSLDTDKQSVIDRFLKDKPSDVPDIPLKRETDFEKPPLEMQKDFQPAPTTIHVKIQQPGMDSGAAATNMSDSSKYSTLGSSRMGQ